MRKKFVFYCLLFLLVLSQCLKKDQICPTIYLINPQDNSNVAGVVRIKAVAVDNSEVTCVEFYVNNIKKGVDSTASNSVYEYVWNTANEPYGTKTIIARAYDKAGNVGESPSIIVNKPEPSPPISPTFHSGVISSNEIWKCEQSPHIITDDVIVDALLTIEAGSVIQFNSGKSLIVRNGYLIARGTNNEPILFTSNESFPSIGDWERISFEYNDTYNSILDNCIIEYANNGIYVEESRVSLTNTLIQKCADYGVVDIYGWFVQFNNNIITQNENYPMAITVDAVHTLGENNNFLGNFGAGYVLTDAIDVFENFEKFQSRLAKRKNNKKQISEIKTAETEIQKNSKKDKNGIVANCRWRNHQVPYLVEGYLYFEDVSSLTIDQGCVVGLTDGIEVSNNACLTATNVTFTSRYLLEDGYGYPGDWEGIWISDGNAFLQDCKIEYAGANDASIVIEELSENQQVIINGCKIKFSGTNGISIFTEEEYCDIEIRNCQISNCYECPVFIENANLVQSLKTNNEFFNNECNYIFINNGYISRSCTWYNCGVPYYIESGLEVSDNSVIFTLSSGIIIGCCDYIYIDVPATLIANNVIFTSQDDIAGQGSNSWLGIEVAGSINLANCIIKYADYGIYLEGNEEESALIQNCQIHSCECGIYVDADENLGLNIANTTVFNCEDVPIELHSANLLSGLKQGNDFSNNVYGVIYVCDDGYISKSGTWYNCQVPYLFDTDVQISDNAVITIMPNVILQFANCKFQIEDGAVIADGSAGTIVFTNYPEYYENWQGIFFYSNNSLNRLKHCIIENGGSHPFYPANIICQSASPRISDCEIANSLGWGIILQNSNLDPDTLRRYNRFFNNDSGDIYVMLPGQVVNSDVIKSPSIKIKRPLIINRARENRKPHSAEKSINKSTLKIKQ